VVAFSPNGNRVASGSSDRLVKIWDAETGAPVSSVVGVL
jgi:WD40 repeat protein